MGEEKMKHKNLKEKRSEDGESGSRLYHHRHPVGRVTESVSSSEKVFHPVTHITRLALLERLLT